MILQKIRDSYIAKGMAVYLAFSLITQIMAPSVSFALTGGPSQPEVQSFSPVGTSDMVNLSSGDFNYNIPLVDVGGYPINIIYNAGVTMDQEASWVGLGWNINPGVINRNMRGLPDDFKGDLVKKITYMKPSRTTGIDVSTGPDELFGYSVKDKLKKYDSLKVGFNFGMGVQYNNYSGVNISTSLGMKASIGPFNAGLGLKSNSNGGLSISPSVSYGAILTKKSNKTSLGFTFNTISGLDQISLSHARSPKNTKRSKSISSSIDLVPNTYTPQINQERSSLSVSFGLQLGTVLFGGKATTSIGAMYSQSGLEHNGDEVYFRGYGYLHSEKAGHNGVMLDFNREKDLPFNNGTTNLPVTNYTYDAYSIQGQGVSGAYRPYRSEIGAVYDNSAYSSSLSGNANLDFSGGNLADLGTDIKFNSSESYSGIWTTDNEALNHLHFTGSAPSGSWFLPDGLYEPVYYKQSGELAVDTDPLFNQIGKESKAQIKLKKHGIWGVKALPVLKTPYTEINLNGLLQRNKRVNRNQLISTLTKAEAAIAGIRKYTVPGVPSHHVSEITVTKNDGSRYVYGIPLYNKVKQDVTFSISSRTSFPPSNANTGLVEYSPGTDDKPKNGKGKDEFYSKTEIPPYAHSYLLSEVLSADYVDVNGNGADDQDYGTYTRFDYETLNDYKWRVPYQQNKANFNEGSKAEHQDETASYIYGEKDLRYLNKIETKTHIAVFHTSDRKDTRETLGTGGGVGTRSMKKLDSISLFAKGDWNANYANDGDYSRLTPIKRVHFEYSYELCKGSPNSIASGGGKLTLKKIFFTYGNSFKAKWSPYVFHYDGNNPTYNLRGYNMWGGYKPSSQPTGVSLNNPFEIAENGNLTTVEYPYVEQDKAKEDIYSSSWALTSIELPSGGVINVEYESDDYAYVQNKRALQMAKIVGANDSPTFSTDNQLYRVNTFGNDTVFNYLFFKRDPSVSIEEYKLNSSDKLYFKFLLKLKENGTPLYDFVSGYCEIEDYGISTNSDYGYIKVKPVPVKDKISVNTEMTHPISKAGWNYTRINLPKIANNQPNNIPSNTGTPQSVKNMAKALANLNMFLNIVNMARGINNRLKQDGYSRKFIQGKSWVRLTNPNGHKLGGGSRVKRITISDRWDKMVNPGSGEESIYGQEYTYLSESTIEGNRISSGVATYEPLQSKENPFVQPIFMTTKHLLVPDDEHFIEEPIGESFFPSPTVTYSRVEVKNIAPTNNQNYGSGKVVNEFYTSRDYPTVVNHDEMEAIRRAKFSKLNLIKGFVKDLMTTSQGHVVINNDMNGKQKAQWILPEGANNISEAISGVEYIYDNNFSSENSNKCILIHKNGTITSGTIGVEYDAVADFREHSTENISEGANAGLTTFLAGIIPGIVPQLWPAYSYSHTRYRSAVFTKVINKHGILREVIAHDLGAKVSTKNLAWDAETGEVLLTSVKNEYGDEIYTLNYPAHWGYEKMGMASKNIHAKTTLSHVSEGVYYGIDIPLYFIEGDELLVNQQFKAWVLKVNSNNIYLIDENGMPVNVPGQIDVKVVRSGRRNQQALAIGSITMKKNPIQQTSSGGYKSIQQVISSNSNLDILTANAVEYNDNWRTFAGANTEGTPVTECQCTPNTSVMTCFENMLSYAFNAIICQCVDKGYKCRSTPDWDIITPNNLKLTAIPGTNQLVLEYPTFPCPIVLRFNDYIFKSGDISSLSNYCNNSKYNGHTSCGNNFFRNINFQQKSCGKDIFITGDFLAPLPGFKGKVATFTIGGGVNCFPNFFNCKMVTVPSSCIKNDCNLLVGDTINPFLLGIKGTWRSKRSSLFLGERNQTNQNIYANIPNDNLDLREDGSYTSFSPFWNYDNILQNWITNPTNWTWTSQVTNYTPIGQEVENQDALGRYSAAIFGYNHSIATAVASNAQQNQIAFDGFEDYNFNQGNNCSNKKHFGFVCHQSQIVENEAHTGRHAIAIKYENSSGVPYTSISSKHKLKDILTPVQNTPSSALPYVLRNQDVMNTFGPATVFHPGEIGYNQNEVEYVLSYWQKESTTTNEVLDYNNIIPSLTIGGVNVLGLPHSKSKIIDGWQKVEYLFKIPNGTTGDIQISFTDTRSHRSYIDDVRIHPFNSSMKSYVYDPISLKIWAELDENNYATFYEYDEEGKLLRIKKETERGVLTIQESRNSSRKNP